MAHTPLPWRVATNARNLSSVSIQAAGGVRICALRYNWRVDHSWQEADANAVLIVRAANCHDDLVAALELLLPVAQNFEKQAGKSISSRRGGPVFEKARAALAKAKDQSQ